MENADFIVENGGFVKGHGGLYHQENMCFFSVVLTRRKVNSWWMTDWGGLGCSPYCLGLKWEVEVGGMWWAWDCSFPPRIYFFYFLNYLFMCMFFWMHFSLYGKNQLYHCVLAVISRLNLNHAVIFRLLVISPFAWVNPFFELVSLVAGCIKSTHDPEIPIFACKTVLNMSSAA